MAVEKRKSNNHKLAFKNIGIALFVVAIFGFLVYLILLWLFENNTTMTGSNPDVTRSSSLSCTSNEVKYPYYNYENATHFETKITAIFVQDKLGTISLTNTLFFNSERDVARSEALNHAAMNISFANNNYDFNLFSMTFARLDGRMVGRIYTAHDNFVNGIQRYYLADGLDMDQSIQEYAEKYIDQGFTCQYQ